MENINDPEAMQTLATKIEALLLFSGSLIEDLPALERCAKDIQERKSYTMSAAPILGAMGIDFEEKNFEWGLKEARINALIKFIKVLQNTEQSRTENRERQAAISQNRELLKNYLG